MSKRSSGSDPRVTARPREVENRQPAPPLTKDQDLEMSRERPEGADLTTDQGIGVAQTDDSLKAGARGPTLIEALGLARLEALGGRVESSRAPATAEPVPAAKR